jgi:hypothetical protein
MQKTRIIILLGMHRSGTSLTASILEALGISLGDELIHANAANERGYFENAAITHTHVGINRILNRRPFSPAGFVEYPAAFWQREDIRQHIDELERIVRAEVERAEGVWGFKDPHTAKLLPIWDILLDRLDIEPVFILAVRHPAEVSASTVKRDHVKPDYGELLWMDNNVAALRNTRYRISLVTDYAEWFSDPLTQARQMMELPGINWSGDDDTLRSLLTARIDPRLYHQHSSGKARLPFAQDLYERLRPAGRNDDGSLRQRTEPLVSRYMESKEMFAPAWNRMETEWVSNMKRKLEISDLETRIAQMEEEIRSQQSVISKQKKSLSDVRGRLQKTRGRLSGVRKKLSVLEATANSVLKSKSGALLSRIQILRQRVAGKPADAASLVRLQKVLDGNG